MKRILVIRGGAIGDFVLTLPAVKLLRDAFPRARLEIVGNKHIVALAENRFYADAIRSLEDGRLASFFVVDADLHPEWSDYFGSFDLIVSYLFDLDGIFEGNLRRCGALNILIGSPKIRDEEHATLQLARPLEALDLFLKNTAVKLFPSEADRDFARKNQSEDVTIAIHPGSGSKDKSWPLEHWLALLNRLLVARAPASLLVIGGEAETEQLVRLRAAFSRRVRFAENLALVHLAALLERSALFIGHDSGISHIAAAVGAPCVLLFGPTDPTVWAPANANVRMVQSRTKNMDDISVDEVHAAIRAAEGGDQSTN